ncbi:MAG: DNA gyrase subunit A [Vulcanimicrobiaceae bacterium]|jgi:DNA gyrase subunit A
MVKDEMERSYLAYAMSVIASRALPDVRDGLKPVQRRILYAMREMGFTPDKQHRKCAGIVGEVLKSYHPHGDSSVYDALVRMAQDFTLRYPLVDGHGNFGSVDGDPPAAYRYTEARLARVALDMLADIDRETVDFIPNFDNQTTEPTVLPSRLPNLLVNGSSGIAVGMATNIPPHNVSEVCDAITLLIDKNVADGHDAIPDEIVDQVLAIVQGPDFPTAGVMMGREAIREAYKTGRGSVIVRGKAEIVEERGKYKIIITEVPFQVTKSRIVEAIAEAYSDKRIAGITACHDESNRKGMRVAVELARNATPNVVLNQLYKHTPLQTTFGFNMLALVPAQTESGKLTLEPQVLPLVDMLRHFIWHRRVVVRRRTEYDLRKAEERAHLLEGFRIALDHIDEVIKIIRASQTVDIARTSLMNRFKLTEIQANAIVDMRLRTLTGLERQKIEDEYNELKNKIADYTDILAKPKRIDSIVKTEAEDVKKRFGDERRTQIVAAEGEVSIEDIIANVPVVITVTAGGYIKRVSVDTFRQQNRGGRGVMGIGNLKSEDVVRNFFIANTHETVLFFTNKGRVFRLKAYEVPETSRQARGTNLVNLLTLPPGEVATAVLPVRAFDDDKYLVMVTRHGVIKKTRLEDFANVRRSGLIAINLDEDDELLAVDLSDGKRDIILASSGGMAVHFNETDVRAMGRPARGVKAMTLGPGDEIMAMDVLEDDRREVLIVTSHGFGKRTPIDEYRHTSRGGKGVKAFARERAIGNVVDQILVRESDELLLITSANNVTRIPVSQIRRAGRSTKGVRLVRLAEGDEVLAVANLTQQSKEIAEITGEPVPVIGQQAAGLPLDED